MDQKPIHRFVMRGLTGELRYGYHRAATLGPWTIDSGSLTATLVDSDAFRLTQAPLTFEVVRPKGRWSWAIADLSVTADGISARIDEEN